MERHKIEIAGSREIQYVVRLFCVGQIDSVSCSASFLLPQGIGSICPASFLVESFLRSAVSCKGVSDPCDPSFQLHTESGMKMAQRTSISAIHPDQSLQSFQLPKLLSIEWLKKIFNYILMVDYVSQNMIHRSFPSPGDRVSYNLSTSIHKA